jgi:hypothetical protein
VGLFAFLAYLAPLLAGLGAAWAWASSEGRPPLRRLARAGLVAGGVALLCLPYWKAGAIALSMAALVSTAYFLARGFWIPAAPAQVVVSFLPLALYALVFLFDPFFEYAARVRMDDATLGRRITLGLTLNPIAVTTISVLNENFYHRPIFYRLDFAAYKHAPPTWLGAVAYYLAASAVLAALAWAVRKLPGRNRTA